MSTVVYDSHDYPSFTTTYPYYTYTYDYASEPTSLKVLHIFLVISFFIIQILILYWIIECLLSSCRERKSRRELDALTEQQDVASRRPPALVPVYFGQMGHQHPPPPAESPVWRDPQTASYAPQSAPLPQEQAVNMPQGYGQGSGGVTTGVAQGVPHVEPPRKE